MSLKKFYVNRYNIINDISYVFSYYLFSIYFSSLFDICVSLCSYAVPWPYGCCASALIRKN